MQTTAAHSSPSNLSTGGTARSTERGGVASLSADSDTDVPFRTQYEAARGRRQLVDEQSASTQSSNSSTSSAQAQSQHVAELDREESERPATLSETTNQQIASLSETSTPAVPASAHAADGLNSAVSDKPISTAFDMSTQGLGTSELARAGMPEDVTSLLIDTVSQARQIAASLPVTGVQRADSTEAGDNVELGRIGQDVQHGLAMRLAAGHDPQLALSSFQLQTRYVQQGINRASTIELPSLDDGAHDSVNVLADMGQEPTSSVPAPLGSVRHITLQNDAADFPTLLTKQTPGSDHQQPSQLLAVTQVGAAPLPVATAASMVEVSGTPVAMSASAPTAAPLSGMQVDGNHGLLQPGALSIFDEAVLPHQLHHHVRWMQMRGQHVAELRLNPEELGPVHVTVKAEERRIEANFVCVQPLTRDLLEAALPRLREAMEAAGMELAGGFVSTGQFGDTPSDMEGWRSLSTPRAAGQTTPGSSTEPVTTPPGPRHEGVIDTFA
jgi:flagellar hook-length control protein FliK